MKKEKERGRRGRDSVNSSDAEKRIDCAQSLKLMTMMIAMMNHKSVIRLLRGIILNVEGLVSNLFLISRILD
jgi:hypothetical protein